MAKNDKLKGIMMGLADYAQNKADEVKYKSKLAITEGKQRENWLWKLQNENQQKIKQRKAQNLMTENFVKRMRDEAGGGVVNFGPEARLGSGGETDIHYPSAKDKEFMIKQGLNRVRLKEERDMPLSSIEQKFKDTYSGMFKSRDELTPYQDEQIDQNKNKAIADMRIMFSSGDFDDADIIDEAMLEYGVNEDWAKSILEGMRSNAPEPEVGAGGKPTPVQMLGGGGGLSGLANIFNF